MKTRVTVVGCGVGPEDLAGRRREAVASAEVLVGGQRLLDGFPDFRGRRVALGAHAVEQAVEAVTGTAAPGRVVVLASGDALFFGIGRALVARLGGEAVEFLPDVTAAQAAFSRLGLPWERARFFSVHGRDAVLPWREVLQAPVAVVYADPARPAAAVAAALVRQWPAAAERIGALCENLGGAGERVVRARLGELAAMDCGGLSLLVVEGAGEAEAGAVPPLPLGLDDEAYAHESGLITHPEIRAVALAKLRLRPGVMWDVGAGSGSVGLEAAGLCPGLDVVAIERQAGRGLTIVANARAAGVARLRVVTGEAPGVLEGLPSPVCVFVGGGGGDARVIVERAFERVLPGGTLVAAAVMLETRARLLDCLPGSRSELLEIEVKRARPLGPGHRFESRNPVSLFMFRK
jgi:precorrin-6Y C5,15-methyltransferase (decarboxylating)